MTHYFQFYQWLDLLWVPAAILIVERGKKLFTVLFVLSCVLLLRLQLELLREIGFPRGVFGWMESGLYERGLITYGAFIAFFLLIARLSKGEMKHVHIAASITIMIAAFCISTIVMVL